MQNWAGASLYVRHRCLRGGHRGQQGNLSSWLVHKGCTQARLLARTLPFLPSRPLIYLLTFKTMTGFGLADHGASVERETHPTRSCLAALEPLWLSPTAGRCLLTWQQSCSAQAVICCPAEAGTACPKGPERSNAAPRLGEGERDPTRLHVPPVQPATLLLNRQRVVLTAGGPTPCRG